MDRLSPLDSSFLHMEDDRNLMHIGSVGVFEGPAPSYADFCAMVSGKLPLVPRYRQRVRFVPLNVGRPVWSDDPHFQIGYHLRHTALPAPGGYEQLRNLASRVMSQRLDRDRPLWELWLVEGLEDGHWGLISKTHHSLVDGVSGTELLGVILDATPEPSPRVPDTWRPGEPPSPVRLVGEAVTDYVASPYEQWRAARSLTLRPLRLARSVAETARGVAQLTAGLSLAPSSSLIGPIGPHRRWAWARAGMDDVRTVRAALGGTVNDVVLAAITRGFRDLLIAHGEPPEQRTVRSLVPVSVRRPDEHGTYNNRVSAMVAELPVGIEDAAQRLASVRAQMERLKQSKQAVAAETLTSLSGFAPPLLLVLGTRAAVTAGRHTPGRLSVTTVTTNVPGPRHPLYALGRRMIEAFPYVPTVSPMRVGVAIFSYEGQFTFGVNADYDAVPDVDVLTAGIEAGLRELVKAAEAAGR